MCNWHLQMTIYIMHKSTDKKHMKQNNSLFRHQLETILRRTLHRCELLEYTL